MSSGQTIGDGGATWEKKSRIRRLTTASISNSFTSLIPITSRQLKQTNTITTTTTILSSTTIPNSLTIMPHQTIHVSNISSQTTQKELTDFFSFCGKISSSSLTPSSSDPSALQSATITFASPTATKTALLLDQTQLGPSRISVTSAASIDDLASGHVASHGDEPTFGADTDPLEKLKSQESKPRATILAEMLAQGYTIADTALEKAISLDKQHGFTTKFYNLLHTLDSKLHATETAKTTDQTYHISEKAAGLTRTATSTFSRYFEKFAGTPTGNRIRGFYQEGEKQVLDVHNEARRLADLKKQEEEQSKVHAEPETTTCNCGGVEHSCKCAPHKCACAGCTKKTDPSEGQIEGAVKDVKDAAKDLGVGSGPTVI